MKNDGGAAFPYFREIPEKKLDEVMTVFHPGMTLRDWFAGQALSGLIVYCEKFEGASQFQELMCAQPWDKLATVSYKYADAMLAAREGKDE